MTRCTREMRKIGMAVPRTCPTCGLGPCQIGILAPSATDLADAIAHEHFVVPNNLKGAFINEDGCAA